MNARIRKPDLIAYECIDGSFRTAPDLGPDDAVRAVDRGWLTVKEACDQLSATALEAVLVAADLFIARERAFDGVTVLFGVRGPAFALRGRA